MEAKKASPVYVTKKKGEKDIFCLFSESFQVIKTQFFQLMFWNLIMTSLSQAQMIVQLDCGI